MKKKVCLILKKNKKFNKSVINFLKKKNIFLDVFLGHVGDKFPQKIYNKNYDIIISYLSPWILKPKVLNSTKMYNINFHPGPPRYPGIGCFNFSILNSEKRYGVTMHLMEKKVDTGKIIKVKYFSSKNLNLIDLINKSYSQMFKLFQQEMNKFFKRGFLTFSKEKWLRKAYKRKELNALNKISLNMPSNKIYKIMKSVYHPDYPGPYFKIKNKKFYLVPK